MLHGNTARENCPHFLWAMGQPPLSKPLLAGSVFRPTQLGVFILVDTVFVSVSRRTVWLDRICERREFRE